MHHQINTNCVGHHTSKKKIKMLILTTIKRGSSIDLKQSHIYAQTASFSKDMKLRRRSFSNSISTQYQDSNRKEPKNYNDNSSQHFNKNQKEPNDNSSQSNQNNSKQNNSNKKNEFDEKENDIYKSRKDEVNFRQFQKDFQSDILQLEVLYYWLSSFGFQRSSPLQLPPLLSYYLYSLIFYRSDMQKLFFQLIGFSQEDEYYNNLRYMFSQYFQQKLQNQSLSQVLFHGVPNPSLLHEYIFADYLDKIIADMKLDYKILLEDFITYFELFSLQKNKIEASLSDAYVFRKNNIAFGNIRFVFKQKDGLLLIDFKQPIGKFQDRQFIDYIQFQEDFAKQVSQTEPFRQFNQYCSEPHSERTLILFLLADIQLDKSIFKNLQIDLKTSKLNNQITLSQIHLEITSENRVCNKCVGMFQMIPIQFICEKFSEKFELEVDKKFQLIITSQYLLDPQVTPIYERCQRIWKKTDLRTLNLQKQQSKDSKINKEDIQIKYEKEILNDYEQPSTEQLDQNDFQIVQQLDLSQKDYSQQLQQEDLEQEYLICYEEQEPSGLVSILFLKERYSEGQFSHFKTNVTQLQIKNTFFLSNESQQYLKNKSDSQNSQQQVPEDGNSQTSHISKKQQNRLLIEFQQFQENFCNLINVLQSKPEQQFQVDQLVQKSKKTYMKYEDLWLEILSEFYAKLIKKFTQDFQFLNLKSF